MPEIVIVGGSVCGLLTAHALAEAGHHVTVLERDDAPLPPSADHAFDAWDRRGAPQVRHSHALLARLRNLLRDRAPAILAALLDAGATEIRFCDDPPPELPPLEPEPGDEDLVAIACRRLTFEWVLRHHVETQSGVTVRTGVTVAGMLADAATVPVVTGVVLADGSRVHADLVVDASGRRSSLATWVEALGAAPIPTDDEDCGLVYLSRFYRLLDGQDEPPRTGPIGADLGYIKYAVFPGDNRCFSVTLGVSPRDDVVRKPLLTPAGFHAAAAALPATAPWVDPERATAITDVQIMAGLRNRRRRFVVDGEPLVLGVVALGDAAVHTNPLYGRGCSLAAVHAFALADIVAETGLSDPRRLSLAIDDVTRRELDPWYEASVMQDRQASAATAGDATAQSMQTFIRDGLMVAARTDAAVFRAFLRLFNLLSSPDSLIRDAELAAHVLTTWNDRESRPPVVLGGPDREAMIAVLVATA